MQHIHFQSVREQSAKDMSVTDDRESSASSSPGNQAAIGVKRKSTGKVANLLFLRIAVNSFNNTKKQPQCLTNKTGIPSPKFKPQNQIFSIR